MQNNMSYLAYEIMMLSAYINDVIKRSCVRLSKNIILIFSVHKYWGI